MERLRRDLLARAQPLTVLLDLELPLLRPGRFLRGAPGLRQTRRALHALIGDAAAAGHRIVTAEYPARGRAARAFLDAVGVAAPADLPHTKLLMAYSSLIPTETLRRRTRAAVAELSRRWPGRVHAALGTLAHGALGWEPTLDPAGLARDLAFYREAGLAAVALFRAGGLTEEHHFAAVR